MDDAALLPELLDGLEAWVPQLSVERVPGASHWLVHEHPERVIRSLHQLLHEALLKRELPALSTPASDTDFPLDY